MAGMVSCTAIQQKETAKESKSSSFQPEPLEDDWSKWLVGKWQVTSGHSDFLGDESEGLGESNEEGASGFIIESILNGQFLTWESWNETGEMTDEQKKQLKEALKQTTNVSDEELERFVSMPYKSLLIQTIDPKTGERIAYCFDSQRLYGQGRGRLEDNKEVMEWEWSGIGRGVTSVGITEKINDNKLSVSMKYTLPDGNKMEEKLEMIRNKIEAEK
ncbi:MAG: hypothetical protein JW715_04080 [Sedimentisphaerales bacterium]|nr:hypothetical protein [Sedimentisphaerales bacterium]